MAEVVALAVVELPTIGGDPLDYSHNTFTFHADTGTADDVATNGDDLIVDFYNDLGTGAVNPVCYYLGQQLSRVSNACTIKWYDITGHLDGSPHGSPIHISHFTLGASHGAGPVQEGVAIALSFHSAYGTDVEFDNSGTPHTRPRARDRGRVYLGPVDQITMAADETTHRIAVTSDCRDDLACAALQMATDSDVSTAEWVVWSRKRAAVSIVVGGWIDDRFDYQRRREDPGLVRRTWATP